MLIVGSRALLDAGISLGREPKDWDVIISWEEFNSLKRSSMESYKACYPLNEHKWVIKYKNGDILECEIAWEGGTGESLMQIVKDNYVSPPDLVYTLKMSHRYLKDSPHFLKTMDDIKLLRGLGAKIPECLSDWYIVREKETYHYQHPNLNRDKKDFFNTVGVVYTYDHDSIHEAVKLFDKPAYNYFKPNDKEVWCSKGMFESLPSEIRLGAVFEESAVLAIERSLVPFGDWSKEDWAFKKALEKVCTSITSGWFREYAWENYDLVLEMKRQLGEGYLLTKFTSGIKDKVIIKLEK
jgi:hypothetical protein